MKSVDQHLADLLDGIGPLEPVEAEVLDALGAVLAADVVSLVDLPVFDSSAITAARSAIADSKVTAWAVTCAHDGFGESLPREVSHTDRSRKFRGAAGTAKPTNRRYEAPADLPASRTDTQITRGPDWLQTKLPCASVGRAHA